MEGYFDDVLYDVSTVGDLSIEAPCKVRLDWVRLS